MASKSSSFPGLLVHKMLQVLCKWIVFDRSSVKQQKKNEENIIKLDVSLNRQNIKYFASTLVIEFHAGGARFEITAVFF